MSLRIFSTSTKKAGLGPAIFKAALLASAVSLLAYIPYKYATQLHAIQGLYAFLFPLSAVVALAGIWVALDPKRVLQLPLVLRAGVGSIATVWMITGLLCVPTLVERTWIAPAAGLFATFHMVAQHLFLSIGVAAAVLAPHWGGRRWGERFILAPKRSA